jgi:hypothetical protein
MSAARNIVTAVASPIDEAERLAPKRLGPRDSGIRSAVRAVAHETKVAPLGVPATCPATPGTAFTKRSPRRASADAVVAHILHEALVQAQACNPDLGAALDLSAEHARQLRIGERFFSAGSVLLVIGGLPAARVAFLRRYLSTIADLTGAELFLAVCVDVFGVQAVMAAVQRGGEFGR